MEINEVKIGDMVTFTHKKKKVTGKVIYRHQDKDKAALMGHVNVEVLDGNSYPVTIHVSKLKPALKEETNMKNLKETRLENTMDLIDLIDSQNHVEAENKFNELLQDKIDAILGVAKEEVASSMFNTENCAECDEELEEAKKMKKEMEDEEEEDEDELDEALKGGQHKIDMNKNGKLDAHDFKMLRAKKKGMKEEVEQMDEASYSAKAAAAGKDIGKKGKMFSKIAKKASRKYGKERGAKIAGAVLAKLRKKGK
jgi:hypothetical protein